LAGHLLSARGYLDQIAVAPEAWGSPAARLLLGAAKAIAPSVLDLHVNHDNARAIRSYESTASPSAAKRSIRVRARRFMK
jgi:ribosomal protein S18 acetylase RimI-like enzyme